MGGSPQPEEERHRVLVRVLVVVAGLLAFLSIFTTWIDRQALDTGAWVDTSGKLLEDKAISDAVAGYAVDQLYANVDVSAVLHKQLPKDLKALSGPAAGGLREVATKGAESALRTGRLRGSWKDANRVAHTQLVAILENRNDAVTTNNGKVVLDLRPLVEQIATRVGVSGSVANKIPADAAQLEIARADQLNTAKTITRLVRGLAVLFSLGTLALFALAVYLARGRRWVVVLGYGLGLIAAGIAALAVRKVAGNLVTDSLVQAESARTAGDHAWSIGTSLLSAIATTAIAYGVLFALASFLASPARGAVTTRQAMAPSLRDSPAVVWSIFAAAVFLFLIVSPPQSGRELLTTMALVGLAAAGLEALRRKASAEFPDARRGEWRVHMRQRAKRAREQATQRLGAAFEELTQDREPEDARLDRIARLAELHGSGALTDEEFAAEKAKLLGATAKPEAEAPAEPPPRQDSSRDYPPGD